MDPINIIQSAVISVPFIAGVYMLFYVLDIADLSIEASYLTGAVTTAQLLNVLPATVLSVVFVVCAALCAGALTGIGTVMIRRYCLIPHVFASIIMIGIVHAGVYAVAGGAHKAVDAVPFGLPFFVLCAAVVSVCFLLFFKTQAGIAMIIYGANKRFLHYHRVSEFFTYAAGIAISNALAGMSGCLTVAAYGFFDLSMAQGVLLQSLCAAMIGFVLLAGRSYIRYAAPILGAFAYALIQHVLVYAGCTSVYFTLIQSALLIGCLLIRRLTVMKGNYE